MKTKLTKLIFILLACTFFLFPGTVYAAGKVSCPIMVQENYTKMTEMFNLINGKRKEKGLSAYTMDQGLTEYAMQRAAEIGVMFTHQRPCGESFDGGHSYGEIISGGKINAADTLKDWMGSSMHVGSITGDYKYCGIGCVESDTRYGIYWVVLVSKTPLNKNYDFPIQGSKSRSRTVEIDTSERLFKLDFTRANRNITFGEASRYPVMLVDPYNQTAVNWSYTPPASILNYSVSDPSVFTVDPITGYFIPHKAGTARVTVSFKAAPSISTTLELNVTAPSADQITYSLQNGATFTYTGKEIKPKVCVKYKDTVLVEGTDYDLTYTNNIKPGTGKITIYTKGNYSYSWAVNGFADLYFTITMPATTATPTPKPTAIPTQAPKPTSTPAPKPTKIPDTPATKISLNDVSAEFVSTESMTLTMNYTGMEIKPKIFVYKVLNFSSFLPLTEGKDYKITYSNHVNPGKATVTITGIGDYTGTKTMYFTIIGKTLSTPTLAGIQNSISGTTLTWKAVKGAKEYYVYRKTTGNWSKIAVTKNLSYLDKTVCGSNGTTYTYTVRAYDGTTLSGYNKKGISILRLDSPQLSTLVNVENGIKISWKSVKGATGYYVYRKDAGGTWKRIASTKNTTFTDTGVKNANGKSYAYTVRAYKGKYYSDFYSGKEVLRLTSVAVSSIYNGKKKECTLKWKQDTKATGYQIQYSLSSTFSKDVKNVYVKSNSMNKQTITQLLSGKTYYFRIRVYKTVNGKNEYSTWSSVKKCKIK